MRQALRENALCSLLAGLGCVVMAWLGLASFAWNDYDFEVRPAYEALTTGHLVRFLQLAPAYGGSLVERAPFALLPGLWGGGQLAVYRAVSVPCLVAVAALGVWLVARMRAASRGTLARALVLGVCVANPVTVRALEMGHPEELLGAVLCVAAVLVAGSGAGARTRWLCAGALLGLAVANKEWALLAVGPVALALEPRLRTRALALAGVVCAAILAPLALVGSGGFVSVTKAAATAPANAIFKPWQLWWFLGHYSVHALGPSGTPEPGYRLGPAWVGDVSHPLILAAGAALALGLWLRVRGARLPEREALLALALVLLARCVLDTWDESYYLLPFLLALVAWEAGGKAPGLPVLAPAASVLTWLSFQWLPEHVSPNAQAAFFLAWSLPLVCRLATRLLAALSPERDTGAYSTPPRATPPASARGSWPRDAHVRPQPAQPMTVSALDRLVRTS